MCIRDRIFGAFADNYSPAIWSSYSNFLNNYKKSCLNCPYNPRNHTYCYIKCISTARTSNWKKNFGTKERCCVRHDISSEENIYSMDYPCKICNVTRITWISILKQWNKSLSTREIDMNLYSVILCVWAGARACVCGLVSWFVYINRRTRICFLLFIYNFI